MEDSKTIHPGDLTHGSLAGSDAEPFPVRRALLLVLLLVTSLLYIRTSTELEILKLPELLVFVLTDV